MSFKFMSWNVRHFQAATTTRIQQVAEHIGAEDPDVFGIIEFQAKDVARRIVTEYYDMYDFGMTDSKMGLEFLIGWRRGKFRQVIYTQRRDFMAGNTYLRPGGLLSFQEEGQSAFTNMLFLHTDSGRTKKDYNARQVMFSKIFSLKSAIQGLVIQNGNARLIVLGDLNTMGRAKTGNSPTVRANEEIANLEQSATAAGMRLLSKSHDKTWSNKSGSMKSDLDHVIASNDLEFREFFFDNEPNHVFEIEVDGWNNLTGNARKSWIKNISDHCALSGEVA
jgi:endonuclease/exonuclease/phosphatase family metal-dependent hydrolase